MKNIKIEFNETGNINSLLKIEDMSNKEVNENIINQLILCEELIEEAKEKGIYDGGYFKIYFKVSEGTVRIDLGADIAENMKKYKQLKERLN